MGEPRCPVRGLYHPTWHLWTRGRCCSILGEDPFLPKWSWNPVGPELKQSENWISFLVLQCCNPVRIKCHITYVLLQNGLSLESWRIGPKTPPPHLAFILKVSKLCNEWNNWPNDCFRNFLAVKTRRYWPEVPQQNDQWLHLVMNFIGRNNGQGLQAFRDGTLHESQPGGSVGDESTGTGQVVVGRRHINSNRDYGHVEVDELIFFNQTLTTEEVEQLYNMY